MSWLAGWFIARLRKHSGVPFLLTITIFGRDEDSRFSMRVSIISKAPKVGSCVACAFVSIDYVDLVAFGQYLKQISSVAE